MKQYKYICASEIEDFYNWEVIGIFPSMCESMNDMVLVMKEDKPIQDYIKLHEATDEQLIEELHRRLIKNNND